MTLLSELDLSIEQACDEIVATSTQDPLVVAHSLLDVASLDAPAMPFALAFAAEDHLEARVRALCEPSWRSSRRAFATATLSGLALLAFCLAFDPVLHDASEAVFELLVGS